MTGSGKASKELANTLLDISAGLGGCRTAGLIKSLKISSVSMKSLCRSSCIECALSHGSVRERVGSESGESGFGKASEFH